MDKPPSSDCSWILVIEALASYKEYPLPTLQELIDVSPLSPEDFPETTLEFIALRCLEELSSYSSSSSTLDSSTVLLDSSRTCQDVLEQIMDQISKEAEFNVDLNSFIMHKRASKMKCQLEKIKDAILDGTLQLPDKLKEKSGLFPTNMACANEGKLGYRSVNRLCSKRTRVDLTDESSESCLNENEVCIIEYDEFLRSTEKIKRNVIEKQVSRLGKEVSENSIEESQISKNVGLHSEMNNTETLSDGSLEDIDTWCTTSSLCQSTDQHEVIHGEPGEGETSDTVHVYPIPLNDGNANNNQHMTNQSQPQSQQNSASSNVSQNPVASDKDVIDIDSETELSSDSDSDSDVYHIEKIALTTKKDEFLRSRHAFGQHNKKKPNVASSNVSQKPVASDKGVVDTDSEAELSSDSDMYHNEEIALTAKTDEFLRSRHAFGQDLPAMTESTGQNLCSKCNEAGQLLVCQTSTCSLMLHKNCLGGSAELDANGNFLCPFCKYSHTISEYLEAKKSSSLAKKQYAIFKSKRIRN